MSFFSSTPIIEIIIWAIIILIGVVSIIELNRNDKDVFIFIMWVVISLVAIFLLITMFSNKFIVSFIIAVILAIIANKPN